MSFLRQFFGLGPSKEEAEAWRQLGSEIGAEFIREGFWRGYQARVVAEVKEWTITLNTFSVSAGMYSGMATYTRMAAPYMTVPHLQVKRSPDGTPMARRTDGKPLTPEDREEARRLAKDSFQFTIYRKNFFSAVGKLLGLQDIAVGDPEFDRDFIIKGNNKSKVRALFANPRIRQLIHQQPSLDLSVKKDEFFCELYFDELGVIKDVVRLKSLFELFEETLNHLCRIG